MKPRFALNLSVDRIGLLHRTIRGWVVVGEVSLEDANIDDALGRLRSTALGLDPRGLSTKLILPDSQVIFTRTSAPGPSQAQRRAQIEAALEGITPYPVKELVFDWVGTGPDVQVAIVARETLDEAETFATTHRFNPVSFVARPEKGGTFNTEPFFGQTAAAAALLAPGAKVERDAEPVRIVGRAILPRKQGESAAMPVADVPPRRAPAVAKTGRGTANGPTDTVAPPAQTALQDKTTTAAETLTAESPVADTPSAKPHLDKTPSPTPKTATVPDAPPKPKAATKPDVTPAPKTSPESPDATALPPVHPQESKPVSDVAPAPKTTPTPDASATSGTKAKPRDATSNGAASDTAEAAGSAPPATDGADTKPETPITVSSHRQPPPLDKTTPQTTSVAAKAPSDPEKPVLKAPAPADADAGVPKPLAVRASTDDIASAAPPVTVAPVPAATPRFSPTVPPRDEAEAMTIFCARGAGAQRGKPRYLGLILTLTLLVSVGLAALWSSRVLGRNDATLQPVQSAALSAAQSQRPSVVASAPLRVPAPQTSADTIARPATPSTAPTSIVSAAAPPLETPAPKAPAPVTAAPPASASGATTAPTPPPDATETAAVAPQAEQPPTDGGTPALPADPTTRLVRADIIVQKAPKAPISPIAIPKGEIYLAGIDPRLAQSTPSGLPAQTANAADSSPPAQVNPPPYGTIFYLNTRGLVKATPDGVETPQGVTVYAALPPVVPPPRPGSAPPAGAAPDATRPAQPTANPALAGLRPRLRPAAGLYAPSDTTQPGDGADNASTSPLAVTSSPVPHTRSADIAGSVSAAPVVAVQAPPNNTDRQDAEPKTTSPAHRLPTKASVANEATMRRAITLNRLSLIGVFGTASNRQALLRTSSGRIVRVSAGDRLDGGKVAAIGQHELHYVKSGRSIVLSMPK